MNLLLVSSSESIALCIADILDVQGHRAHIFNTWHSAEHARRSRRCTGYVAHVVPSLRRGDIDCFLRVLTDYCEANRIDMIVPVGLWGTFLVAQYKASFPVPFVYPVATPEQLYRLHNKWTFYQDLTALGLPVPTTAMLDSALSLEARACRYPVMLKPATKGASKGVVRCHSAADVEMTRASSPAETLLMQEWIPGIDAVFGVFARNGEVLSWTLHKKEADYVTFFADDRILHDVKKIIRACQFTGVCNFDLRLSDVDSRHYFLECNPRFWASVGVSAWYGVDFVRVGMLIAQGLPIPDTMRTSVRGVVRLPNPDIANYIKNVLRGNVALMPKHTDLPWRLLTDPVPLVLEYFRRRSIEDRVDDTELVDTSFAPGAIEPVQVA